MAMDVEAEIRDLKRRDGEFERGFGFLVRQVRDVHKALLTFHARTEAFQARTEKEFKNVNGRLDRVEKEVRGLRKDLPGIVGDAMREAQRGPRGKPNKTS
jgi:hypothetical protein